jgi:hypothetical protein
VKVVLVKNHSVYNITKLKVSCLICLIIDHILIYLVSKPAPSFEGIAVINGEFKEVSLDDFKNKYLVLLFYPLDL